MKVGSIDQSLITRLNLPPYAARHILWEYLPDSWDRLRKLISSLRYGGTRDRGDTLWDRFSNRPPGRHPRSSAYESCRNLSGSCVVNVDVDRVELNWCKTAVFRRAPSSRVFMATAAITREIQNVRCPRFFSSCNTFFSSLVFFQQFRQSSIQLV